MFDHVKFGVSDDGIELSQPNGSASLCLCQSQEKPAHLHLAFAAKSRAPGTNIASVIAQGLSEQRRVRVHTNESTDLFSRYVPGVCCDRRRASRSNRASK